jgi:hypothetical protein
MRTQTFHLGHPGHLEDFFFRVGVLLEASIALQDFEGACKYTYFLKIVYSIFVFCNLPHLFVHGFMFPIPCIF